MTRGNFAGYFQPAEPSGKANGKKEHSEEDRSPLSAAYKAVLEAQIVEGTEVGQFVAGLRMWIVS